jgi:hypothetical protein
VRVYTARTAQQLLAEFWTPTDWLPFMPDLNPLDFTIWHTLQAKTQATPHANLDSLHLSLAVEQDWLAAENIRKPAAHPAVTSKPLLKKNEVKIE